MKGNRGLVLKPISENKDWVLGGFSKLARTVLMPSRDWTPYLPTFERQLIKSEDTFACTAYGLLNAVEILLRFLTKKEHNFSDRFLSIIADIKLGLGADPHETLEALRKNGVCTEVSLPGSAAKTVQEFYTPKPMTEPYKIEAENVFKYAYDFNHEYLFNGNVDIQYKQSKLLEGLQYGPVNVSVDAWNKLGEYYIKVKGNRDNHWVTLVKAEIGKYWLIYDSDSDENKLKKLDWNYDFTCAKLPYLKVLSEKESLEKRTKDMDIITKIINLLLQMVGLQSILVERKANTPEPKITTLDWNVPAQAKLLTIKICEDEGLIESEIKLLCAVIQQESGWKIDAKNVNKNGTTDHSLCQFNDNPAYGWIGLNGVFKTVQEVYDNPEKQILTLIDQYKKGNLKFWAAYSSGAYKRYL